MNLPKVRKSSEEWKLSRDDFRKREIVIPSATNIDFDIEDKNVFNLISEWQTRQHLDHHMRSDRFSVLLGTKSLLSEPLKIQIFAVSDFEGMEAVNFVRKKETYFPN